MNTCLEFIPCCGISEVLEVNVGDLESSGIPPAGGEWCGKAETDRTTKAGKDSELTQGNHQPITARMVPGFVPGGAARSVTAIRKSQRGVAH